MDLITACQAEDLKVPPGLVCLISHDHGHEGAVSQREKRKFIYRILFKTMVTVIKKKGTYIWPGVVRDAIRARWPDEEERKNYDTQQRDLKTMVTEVEWGPCHCEE